MEPTPDFEAVKTAFLSRLAEPEMEPTPDARHERQPVSVRLAEPEMEPTPDPKCVASRLSGKVS